MGDFPSSSGWISTDRTEKVRFSDQIRSGRLNSVSQPQIRQPTRRFRVQGVETRRRPVTGVESAGYRAGSDGWDGWVGFWIWMDSPNAHPKPT